MPQTEEALLSWMRMPQIYSCSCSKKHDAGLLGEYWITATFIPGYTYVASCVYGALFSNLRDVQSSRFRQVFLYTPDIPSQFSFLQFQTELFRNMPAVRRQFPCGKRPIGGVVNAVVTSKRHTVTLTPCIADFEETLLGFNFAGCYETKDWLVNTIMHGGSTFIYRHVLLVKSWK